MRSLHSLPSFATPAVWWLSTFANSGFAHAWIAKGDQWGWACTGKICDNRIPDYDYNRMGYKPAPELNEACENCAHALAP